MKNYLKRTTTFFLALLILVSVPLQAFAEASGNSKVIRKEDYINKVNKLPVKVKKTDNAEELVKNPEKAKLYTVHADFKVQRGDDQIVAYQPYIATAGENISEEEKAKINKLVKFPVLDGYTSATKDGEATIDYKFIKKRALSHDNLVGDEYKGNFNYLYTPKSSTVKVKHVFQDINDFNKYGRKPGDTEDRIDEQKGLTGTSLTIQPLPKSETVGYVPESANINTQVPEHPDYFVVEYRYNLAHYAVNYNTDGGTPLPTRTAFYKQTIPSINEKDIPTKEGGEFQGWKPSVDIDGTGKTFKAGEVMKDASGKPILDLNANLIMPASNVTFTAVWKDKEKADYAVQFWTEKADHADNASILDKYEYMGTRVYKDKDTGTRPDLDKEPVNGLKFPDLDDTRLQKIWANARFNRGNDLYLNKFFVYNKDLTDEQNKDLKQPNLVKSVNANGKTVYNIYYDRQVYDLYFTKSNAQPAENTFYPEIWGYDEDQGEVVKKGGPGNPYHYKARFNQLMLGWPNDAMQTKGFSKGMQSFGWGPNYNTPNWPGYLDTPPYRLNADQFLDMPNYIRWGGYTKKIDKGDETSIKLNWDDYTTLSFGINQAENSMPHHMDFWMDGFKDGETVIRYDLYRSKADTNSESYAPKYPKVQGFTGKKASEPAEFLDEGGIDDKNEERAEVTPFPTKTYTVLGDELPVGKMKFISAFFNNVDEFGDPLKNEDDEPLVKPFEKNGYLRFKYSRNKYPLRFNYDPSIIRDDSYFNSKNQLETFYEFPLKALSPDVDTNDDYKKVGTKEGPKNLLDDANNLYKLGLYDLLQGDKDNPNKFFQDANGNYRVKRPEGLSDQMVFKGWALDPAGEKMVWNNPKETMPFHPVNLYAKWAEPDYKWKVTFDPDGGTLNSIDKENLTTELKNIKEGDVGQEVETTYPIKEAKDGDKQIFTVVQRQKLVEPKKPKKEGYNFMGWEIIRYKKDEKGDYTNEVDNSYRGTYKVPELYSFGNEVVGPIYLKAIWVESNLVDVESHHHFLDENYEEIKQDIQPLKDRRVGSYIAAVGSRQNAERLLVPKDEWDKLEENNTTKLKDSLTYAEYKKLDSENPRVNSYNQQIRVEPEKIPDPNDSSKLIDNPDAKLNQFHFYYRPFRHREYKINYLDERGRKEVEKFINESKKAFKIIKDNKTLDDAGKVAAYKDLLDKNKEAFKTIREKYAIIDQELVKNGKRDFDARNYRTIEGWVLDDKTQQQLFFDINDDSSAFYGINETGLDEINFFYKDVRVIETKKDGPVPDGYVRVTFKADKGGSFGKDAEGKDITELNYDVIKGLKSDLLPVPTELGTKEDGTPNDKEEGKYYITPDDGKKFVKWDEKPLLNKNTIVDNDTKDFYVFTAKFDWQEIKINPLVITEAFIDPNDKWTNDFAPTIDKLKGQVKWYKNKIEEDLPAGTTVSIVIPETQIYEQFKEHNRADKDELVRDVEIPAIVKFSNNSAKSIKIPVKVYKNVYEALNKAGDKPLFLKEAEGKEAKDGGLKDVTGNYVKVTVQPTEKNTNKDAKVYYVNPKAWVNIPEVTWSQDDKDKTDFLKWTADKKAQNENKEENGVFDFSKRHKFTDEETLIKPLFTNDVVEQKEGEDKPKVPGNFVKVIVKTTEKATSELTQIFWVNPTREVTIPVTSPTGKTDQEVEITGLGKKKVNYIFKEWQKVQTGEADDSLTKVDPVEKIELASHKYTDKVTVIEAVYKKSIAPGKIEEPLKTTKLDTPQGKEITNDDLIKQITPQKGKEIVSIEVISKPDGNTVGNEPAKVIVKYKDGSTQGTDKDPVVIPVEVHKNIIPEAPGGQRPKDAMDNYVKVIFKAGTGGRVSGDTVYYVSPEVEVDMTKSAGNITKTPEVGYISGDWDTSETKKLKATFKEQTEFTFNFTKTKDIVEKTDEDTKKPEGYVTVKLIPTDKATDNKEKVYFVNPNKEVTIPDNTPTGKEITDVNGNKYTYVFKGWRVTTGVIASWDKGSGDENPVIKSTFKQDTDITAKYNIKAENLVNGPIVKENVVTQINKKPQAKDLIKNVYDSSDPNNKGNLPDGTKFEYVEEPDVSKAGDITAKVKVTYPNNKTVVVEVPIKVVDNVIPQEGTEKPKVVPDNFVLVEFKAGLKGSLAGTTKYWVDPTSGKKLSDITHPSVTANEEWKNTGWDKLENTEINAKLEVTAQYLKKVLTEKPTENIGEYVKVEFKEGDHGTIAADATKAYWVLKNETVSLTVPTVTAKEGYAQKTNEDAWSPKLATSYSNDTTHIAQYVYNGENVIPQKGNDKPNNVPDDFVLVEFNQGAHGTIASTETTKYWVSPKDLVTLTPPEVKANSGYEQERGLGAWDKYLTGIFSKATTITAQYRKIEVPTPPTPGDQDNPDRPNPEYPGGSDYPYYPGGPIPMYPEVRYETIIQEKIVKVPVPVSDNYFKEIRYMQGFNGYFRPNDGLTRAEAAQILANALVEDGYKYNPNFKISYKDVGEAWYTRAVKIVTEANVFAGYDDGNFKPQAKITRNEWIATLKRFQELGDASGNNMNLRDDHWAKGEIQAAFNEGWLKIYTDGLATYKGDEFIPRQEVAAVSNKAFKRIVDKTYIGKNNLSLVTYKDVNTSMWAYEDILCASNTFLDRKDRYIAHWVKEDKNQFNIDTSDLKIVQKNFQRNPR